MPGYVDRARWRAELQRPDWYLRLPEQYEALLTEARASPPTVAKAIADEVYGFFEDALDARSIALGSRGRAWDSERESIDTAVIHHTGLPSGITLRRIDAIHLTRIYARYYADPAPSDAEIRGQPIYSGHFRGARQIFIAYHWLIRADGGTERLLGDEETGWQAGDWEINCRSIGICLDGAFHENPPGTEMINATKELIASSYPRISAENIRGHREINPKTNCPGETFLANWKSELISGL
jgi:hypothetical protein